MSRISRLEAKLRVYTDDYDRRLKQLEGTHMKEPFSEGNGWSETDCCYEKCLNCELKLKAGEEQCTSERKELEARLAVVKKENE